MGPLASAVADLSRQTDVSIGLKGQPPDAISPGVKGFMTVDDALDHLLAGSGLRAVVIGPKAYRLERVRAAPHTPAMPALAPPIPEPRLLEEIVVTGMKRPMPLSRAPQSISVLIPGNAIGLPPLPDTEEVAARTLGLTLTRLGPGRSQMFIRGVADGAFLGTSQSTVSIYLDESRLTYAAPNPDLMLVDMARVEVLKGPQGPLYGTGALGGVYRMVTNRPVLDDVSAQTGLFGTILPGGGGGGGGSAMLNVPVLQDRLAVRLVGYGAREPGWVEASRFSNDTLSGGGRLAIRWVPATDWSVDVTGAAQVIDSEDGQYLAIDRSPGIGWDAQPEAFDTSISMASATISGSVGELSLLSNTSWARQTVNSGYGNARPDGDDPNIYIFYRDRRRYDVLSQEIRLSSNEEAPISWVSGISALSSTSMIDTTATQAGQTHAFGEGVALKTTEAALFGEVTWRLGAAVEATAGARFFHSRTADKRRSGGDAALSRDRSRWALSPSLSLSWQPTDDTLYYIRYASAFRAAALGQTVLEQTTIPAKDDELSTLDAGTRMTIAGGRISLNGSTYLTVWRDMQSNYLLENGLVTTVNVGDGRIYGVEGAVAWTPAEAWTLELGGTLQHARLVKPTGDGSMIEGNRLPIVPEQRLRLALTRRFHFGGWTLNLRGTAERVGSTRLSFQPGLNRFIDGYALYGFSTSLQRGSWTGTLRVDNLLDNYKNVFPYGNPFTAHDSLQTTRMRPLTLTLNLSRQW